MTAAPPPGPVLEVDGLCVDVATLRGRQRVVDGVSFRIGAGEVLALAGESGSGKTMSALAVVGLLPRVATVSGSIRFRGTELVGATARRWRSVRGGGIGVVFQEPMSALHPAKRVGAQVAEGVRVHRSMGRKAAWDEAVRLLELVGIPDAGTRARSYPHELSGGLQQRIAIAIALSGKPALLIADEPTTALDTTVQAQVMRQLRALRRELGLAVLFISHDLALIAELADRAAIMYAGRVVEEAPLVPLFARPEHPYTESLLAAATRSALAGPRAGDAPSGAEHCPYVVACPYREDACGRSDPPLVARSAGGGQVRCLRHGELTLAGVGAAAIEELPA